MELATFDPFEQIDWHLPFDSDGKGGFWLTLSRIVEDREWNRWQGFDWNQWLVSRRNRWRVYDRIGRWVSVEYAGLPRLGRECAP